MLEAFQLVLRKNQDYNAKVDRSSYFPMGLASYAQMIHVKSQRLVSLAASGGAPNFESVRDTALDLINYATFLAEAVDSGEIK